MFQEEGRSQFVSPLLLSGESSSFTSAPSIVQIGLTEPWVHAQLLSCVWLLATLWTVARQAPLPMGFSQARILEWAVISSSRESTRPRGRTHMCSITGSTHWATRDGGGRIQIAGNSRRKGRKKLASYQEFSSKAFFIEWIGSKNFFFSNQRNKWVVFS